MKKITILSLFLFGLGLCFITQDVNAAGPSKKELEAAKKAGDSDEVTKATAKQTDYEREADLTLSNEASSGKSTYGVVGFDYLTGVGKIGTDVTGTTLGEKNPLKDLMNKRFTGKQDWTGKADATHSGMAQKTGVTEVWNRGKSQTKLGGDYDEWVNQWNIPTRPKTEGNTTVAGADPDQGAHWYSFYCVHCHGWTGKGDGPTAPELDPRPRNQTNGKYMNNISNLDLFAVVKGGGKARNLSEAMPPWGNVLQDQDIWNTVAFMRTLSKPGFKGGADEVTAANAAKNEEFQEVNEELELEGDMAGRGGNHVGGYDVAGGGRISSKAVGVGGVKSSAVTVGTGDWQHGK